MGLQTILHAQHQQLGGKIVDFADWDMPLHYGSQLQEHHHVRQSCGVFDVSHMTIVDIHGAETKKFLRFLLANDIARLKSTGRAMYSCMLNEQGGVIDDLIAYYLADDHIRLVVNCGTREKDLAWLKKQAQSFDVQLTEDEQAAIVAIQGPEAVAITLSVLASELSQTAQALKPFQCAYQSGWLIARTGYTGEDGFEIMLPATAAVDFWTALIDAGAHPCGLGARDTLRLEAGMNLYGTDMDDNVSPLAAGLGWTINWDDEARNFIGKAALIEQKASGLKEKFVGLLLEGKGVLRNGLKVVVEGVGEGQITSGGFSPTLNHGIALARVPRDIGEQCHVEMRGKLIPVRVVKTSFVRHGKSLVE